MGDLGERCDVAGCPQPEDHFPLMQLALPLDLGLAAELMRSTAEACARQGLLAAVVDLPGHGNGRLYASLKA
jgi:hypothetical protein